MTHFLFPSRRQLFHETRLLRMAPPPGEMPDRPVDGPQKSVDNAKHREVNAEAGKRLTAIKDRIARMKADMDSVAKMKETGTVDAAKAKALGIKDVDTPGIDDKDIDAHKAELEAKIKTEQGEADKAVAEMATSVDAIAQSGPAGKIDAALLKMENAFKNGGSIGEMLVAIADVMKTLQDLFKGVDGSGANGAESGKSGPAASRKEVKDMFDDPKMKAANADTLEEMVDAKQDLLDKAPNGIRVKLPAARTAAGNARALVGPIQQQLDALNQAEVKDPAAISAKQAELTGAEAKAKGLEDAVKTMEAEEKKIMADIKKIEETKKEIGESKDKFNASVGAIRASIDSTISKMPEGEPKDDLQTVADALDGAIVDLEANQFDMKMDLKAGTDAIAFQKAFISNNVTNTASFNIDPAPGGTKVGDPEALMKGIQQLITNIKAKYPTSGEKK